MKPHAAFSLICASLTLAGCENEPMAVEHELVAGRTFNVTRVDGQPLPVMVGQRPAGRVLVCENAPLIRSTLSFRPDGLLEQAMWTSQDARAMISLMNVHAARERDDSRGRQRSDRCSFERIAHHPPENMPRLRAV